MARCHRGILFVLCLALLVGALAYERIGSPAPATSSLQGALPATTFRARAMEEPAGGQVSVLGSWSGPELESFWAVVQPFTQRTRVAVRFESTPDVAGILAARVGEGAAPDIAVLPGVALLQSYARAGHLVPLRQVLDVERLARQYPAGWLGLASLQGEPYGLPYRGYNKSVVWYNPAEFQRRNWTVPLTWDDLIGLSDRIAKSGLTPWSLGLKSHSASGEAGTDWIENILLRSSGPETYDRWVRHEIPWTDPAVRQAFQRWSKIAGRPRNLDGGARGALQTHAIEAVDALYGELPAAYLHLGGSAAQPFIARRFPRHTAEQDYDFFPLPPQQLADGVPIVGGADLLVMFNDTPEARALLRYLAGGEAQMIWVQRGGFIALGGEVGLQAYPDPLSRRAARQLLEADVLRYDASEQMPPEVAQAFRRAVLDFVDNPGRLDAILRGLEAVACEAHGEGPRGRGISCRSPLRPRIDAGLPAWDPVAGAPGGTPFEGTPEGEPTE